MPKPDWLKVRIQDKASLHDVESMLARLGLSTVCEEAGCPNRMECFARKTATFMILGSICTRNCTFCAVGKGAPAPADPGEPARVAEGVRELGLRHAVVTSVTRDDLPDGGAGHFAETIQALRGRNPGTAVEVLIPDFRGSAEALERVVRARPDILNHNVETAPRLYPEVRPMADYRRSLGLLGAAKGMDGGIHTKSGIMLGLGEQMDEVRQVMRDLLEAGCDFLTIGQYLAPSRSHHPVVEYIHPDIFAGLKADGENMGFQFVSSGPLVRSSYMAEKALVPSRLSYI